MTVLQRQMFLFLAVLMLTACSRQPVQVTPAATSVTLTAGETRPVPTGGVIPDPTSSATPSPTALGLDPEDWKNWPVIPVVLEAARLIYLRGQELGTDPHAFSVFGDCQSEPEIFLGVYDTDPDAVAALPPELQDTVAYFSASFNRSSPTVRGGTTAGALLWNAWHQGKYGCLATETPMDCELRLHKPSFVIIHVGTHYEARNFDYLRRILSHLIERGVVPILATKADNYERDGRVNRDYARLAAEYNLPLWNFWAAVSDLPNRGLYTSSYSPDQGDVYLTNEALEIHRFTALQALDAVWRAVTGSH